MRASRLSAEGVREVVVFECGRNHLVDNQGTVYRFSGRTPDLQHELFASIDADTVRVAVCACESAGRMLDGARLSDEGEHATIERCELCQRFRNDGDATRAFGWALNASFDSDPFTVVWVVEEEEHRMAPRLAWAATGTPCGRDEFVQWCNANDMKAALR